jgi:biotin carboxyl carrier protein
LPEILAPITGNVWEVHAAEGQEVGVGDLVAVIESMKLEIPVESEISGTVSEVRFAPGDPVAEDDVMFVLD